MTVAVELLEKNATAIGLGQIYYGPTLSMNYNVGGLGPGHDPRTPDIIVTPNVGVTYSGSTTMIADHGGFAHDDTNVVLLVSHPRFTAQTVSPTATTQVAPTILKALGLDPAALTRLEQKAHRCCPRLGRSSQVVVLHGSNQRLAGCGSALFSFATVNRRDHGENAGQWTLVNR